VALAIHLTVSQMLQFAALGIASPAGIARGLMQNALPSIALGGASPLPAPLRIAHNGSGQHG
jgi:hypothetical protein